MISNFAGSGERPLLDTMCPRYGTEDLPNVHFFGLQELLTLDYVYLVVLCLLYDCVCSLSMNSSVHSPMYGE